MAKTDRTRVHIRLCAKGGRTRAEGLGGGLQLGVDLESDNGFVRGRHAVRKMSQGQQKYGNQTSVTVQPMRSDPSLCFRRTG